MSSATEQRIAGMVIGLVADRDDPDKLGRIRLKFPWMDPSEPLSNWARIASPLAGNERGQQFMPELDDEALVAFEQGDLTRPYVIGFLWNGKDKPPRSKPEQRVLRSVSGHTLEFDDTEGSEKISLLFKGDLPGITIEQTKVSIKLSDSCYIEMKPDSLTIVNSTLVQINP